VFHISGGNINHNILATIAKNNADFYLTDYFYSGTNIVADVGEFAGDLIILTEVNLNVCLNLNKQLGISPTLPAADSNGINISSGIGFKGVYTQSGSLNAYTSTLSACFQDTSTGDPTSGYYYYYQVLIVR
jgi:hypothetical protein